jgi:hypothetical protein
VATGRGLRSIPATGRSEWDLSYGFYSRASHAAAYEDEERRREEAHHEMGVVVATGRGLRSIPARGRSEWDLSYGFYSRVSHAAAYEDEVRRREAENEASESVGSGYSSETR